MRRFITLTTLAVVAVAPAVATPEAQAFETLSRGDRGNDVRLVQRALTRVGLRTSADGVFGRRTARSVRRYERREDIRVDARVSRGQARGLFKRARMDPSLVDRASGGGTGTGSGTPRSAPSPGSTFPVQGSWKRGDGFGERSGGHDGVDVLADCGTPLVAAEGGKVVFTGSHSAAGEYLVVRSAASGEDHVYMHLQGAPTLKKGDAVDAGQRLGAVGATGNASTCHLHFEIWTAPGWYEGGAARDPEPDLERWAAS